MIQKKQSHTNPIPRAVCDSFLLDCVNQLFNGAFASSGAATSGAAAGASTER